VWRPPAPAPQPGSNPLLRGRAVRRRSRVRRSDLISAVRAAAAKALGVDFTADEDRPTLYRGAGSACSSHTYEEDLMRIASGDDFLGDRIQGSFVSMMLGLLRLIFRRA